MNEHSFIRAVHRRLPANILRWKINDSYAGGVPDAFYAGAARCLFVEYKFVKIPVRDSTNLRIGLSEQQKLWLNKMHNMGQSVAVVIGSQAGALILTNSAWNESINKATYLELSSEVTNVAAWIHNHCWMQNYDHEEGIFCGSQ
jgi:hypothetical protein